MFTGIVEEVGTVKSARPDRVTITAKKVPEDMKLGDSIAVNGVCLTVVALDSSSFTVDVMPETLRLTSLGDMHTGDAVNLERALVMGGRMGGHFVQGHVEGTGKVLSMTPEKDAILVKFSLPKELSRYVVKKGFIAVDGISLTIVDCDDRSFSVSLVTFTQNVTTMGRKKIGDCVNLETDVLAKYVERLIQGDKAEITRDYLAEHGYTADK